VAESLLYFLYPHECLYVATGVLGLVTNVWTTWNFYEFSTDDFTSAFYFISNMIDVVILTFNGVRCFYYDDWVSNREDKANSDLWI
jgi:hypothetical protein